MSASPYQSNRLSSDFILRVNGTLQIHNNKWVAVQDDK
jgi:hypothetical protein